MNTIIKDLAFDWWCKLSSTERNDIRDKMDIPNLLGEHFTEEQIENIFYQEMIVKWFQSHALYQLCKTMVKDQIIAAYLEEHTKEQPKNEWVSCEGYSAQEYPDFKKGWGIDCFNGTKGTIEAYHNPYLYIEGQVDEIHKMNVKAYMTFEQPLSVNKDVEVDGEFISGSCKGEKCTMCGKDAYGKVGEEIAFDDPNQIRHNLTAYVCKEHFEQILMPYKQPKVEVDSWDKVRKEYKIYKREYEIAEMPYSDFLEWLEDYYTLTKKQ